MRRGAGEWLRSIASNERFERLSWWSLGFGVASCVVMEMVSPAPLWVFGIPLATWAALGPFIASGSPGWRLRSMVRGARAEREVGQVLEYALTGGGCGIAHGVTEVAAAGDIDHLLVTPQALWVVETKSGRVPLQRFDPALKRIAWHMQAVRRWAPAGTLVRGCLVVWSDEAGGRRSRNAGGETIQVYDRAAARTELVRALRREVRGERRMDPTLARRVWKLGAGSDENPEWGVSGTRTQRKVLQRRVVCVAVGVAVTVGVLATYALAW